MSEPNHSVFISSLEMGYANTKPRNFLGKAVQTVSENQLKATSEDLELAIKQKGDADKNLVDTEIRYLKTQGFTIYLDHKKNTIRWITPGDEDANVRMPRQDAVAYARNLERKAKEKAKQEIERLKAEHGIVEVCGK